MKFVAPSLLMLAAGLSAAPHAHDPKVAEEFRARDGLPNVFAKIRAGKTVRVAYLGGSITAAKGWRPKTMAWFRQQFPEATFVEINAAISGTGSDYSACRLAPDVLAHEPDLVFLECRVNGGGGYERQSVEGVVRQTWRHNPATDICFVYTISLGMLKDIQAGRQTGFGTVMETIANRYGIPTIDLGVEIARREQAGTLVFKAAEPAPGRLLFSKDGVHPGEEGHQVYCETVARSFLAMQDRGAPRRRELGEPLAPDCWETAALLPIAETRRSAGWVSVDEATDPVYRNDLGRTRAMLRAAVKCTRPGETITVRWTGTTLGFSDIPHGGSIVVAVSVDGGAPVVRERTRTREPRLHSRFWYLPALPPGEHEAVFTVRSIPEGAACYAGQVLVVGTPLSAR